MTPTELRRWVRDWCRAHAREHTSDVGVDAVALAIACTDASRELLLDETAGHWRWWALPKYAQAAAEMISDLWAEEHEA